MKIVSGKTLLVVAVNCLLIVAILYGFEHFLDPYNALPDNGNINGEIWTWGHRVQNNRLGFRERDFDIPKPRDVYRVMVLGDSLTWGAGLAVEQRYTSIAEQLLNDSRDNTRYEVLNFGISGGPTIVERDILVKTAEVIEPDRIVVGFCLNDPQPRSQTFSIERYELENGTAGQLVNAIARSMHGLGLTYTSRLLHDAFYKAAELLDVIPTWQQAMDRTYQQESAEWQLFIQALKDIKAVSDQAGLPPPVFAILNQGTRNDRPTSYAEPDEDLQLFLKWYHQAEAAARDTGYVTYNHEQEIIKQLSRESLAVNIMDGHPSASLNRIYGEKLHQVLAGTAVTAARQGIAPAAALSQATR